MMNLETLLKDYHNHVSERANDEIPPLPLNAEQTNIVIELLEKVDKAQSDYLINLLTNRVPPGVDEAAYVKASWLTAIANGEKFCDFVSPVKAIQLLGTMIGGYNVNSLVEILKKEDKVTSQEAANVLKKIGAILPPIIIPPVFLFGTKGIFSPICQMSELIADFRELPVPTTSPTYAI